MAPVHPKPVLITGSAGQAGTAIAELLSPHVPVVGLDVQKSRFTSYTGSITDWATVKELTKNVGAIIHTASLHAPHVPTHTREQFVDTNIKGVLYLLEAAKLNGVPKFVYTSTTSLYGESMNAAGQAVWVTESLPQVARDIYDITKIAAEALCKDFFEADRLQTLSLRVSRFWDEPLPHKVFYRMYRGVDVKDVAMAHLLALRADFSSFEAFNISAQSPFSQEDLVALRADLHTLLAKRYPRIIDFFRQKNWPLPTEIDRVYVIEKAKKLLKYEPAFSIDVLLDQLTAWKPGFA